MINNLESSQSGKQDPLDKIHCPECHKVIKYPDASKPGDRFDCPCGRIRIELYSLTVLKGKSV